ncbi:hypothetical protein J3A83DRAFT_2611420 [Scleroderma citrinum]
MLSAYLRIGHGRVTNGSCILAFLGLVEQRRSFSRRTRGVFYISDRRTKRLSLFLPGWLQETRVHATYAAQLIIMCRLPKLKDLSRIRSLDYVFLSLFLDNKISLWVGVGPTAPHIYSTARFFSVVSSRGHTLDHIKPCRILHPTCSRGPRQEQQERFLADHAKLFDDFVKAQGAEASRYITLWESGASRSISKKCNFLKFELELD